MLIGKDRKDLASLGTDRTEMKGLRLGLGVEVCQNVDDLQS